MQASILKKQLSFPLRLLTLPPLNLEYLLFCLFFIFNINTLFWGGGGGGVGGGGQWIEDGHAEYTVTK